MKTSFIYTTIFDLDYWREGKWIFPLQNQFGKQNIGQLVFMGETFTKALGDDNLEGQWPLHGMGLVKMFPVWGAEYWGPAPCVCI